MKLKEVTREEYMAFVRSWPRSLTFDVNQMTDVPIGTYNDFTIADFVPESVVAQEFREWLGCNGEIDTANPGKFWKYYVLDTQLAQVR